MLAAPRPAAAAAPSPQSVEPEPITGRYRNVAVLGRDYRIYWEEAGAGIPLVCLHTAGADGQQFRHLMCDPTVTDRYRVIAFDMPWHGKSLPPAGFQREEYRLTTELYAETIRAVCGALDLDQPVIMGCSMGGRIVLHLARQWPDEFRAVISLEGSDHQQPWYDTEWLHRPDVHGGEICAALVSGLVAPTSPDETRWETLWGYLASGPGIFKGDLYFYRADSDYRGQVSDIDTSACPVFLLTGAYDYSCTPEDTTRTAAQIDGAEAIIMDNLGHFPMSENPALFGQHILPILDKIEAEAVVG
ncbi:MAG: alpha/beta hydrolase [Alphaproteobacteria bacterium]|nr:alpha/beta hydrolase [Alphaproteobacteria bacterium]